MLVTLVLVACSGLAADRTEQIPLTSAPAANVSPPETTRLTSVAPPPTLSMVDAAEAVKKYTVLIVGGNRNKLGTGTGISLGDGKVLTNDHVVAELSQVWVRFADGFQEQAQVLRTDLLAHRST
jgi:S1-C subfamily serine protease